MGNDDGVISNLGKTVRTFPNMIRVLEILMIALTILVAVLAFYLTVNEGAVKAEIGIEPLEVKIGEIQTNIQINIPFIDRILDALGSR